MNSEFCMHCGFKVEFSLKAPNFCPSCGSKFNDTAKASQETPETQATPTNEEGFVPRISKLEYSIGDVAKPMTFGDLAAQAQTSSQPYKKAPRRPSPPLIEGEDLLKTTIAECASARQPREISD